MPLPMVQIPLRKLEIRLMPQVAMAVVRGKWSDLLNAFIHLNNTKIFA